MKKCDNRGFTLVELVICIAIMGIIIGMLVANLNYIGNSQAKSLANAIKTAVGQARIETMGKYDSFLYIYKSPTDNKYYKEVWKRSNQGELKNDNRELLGKTKPTVKYRIKGETDATHELDGSMGLLIKFDRTNGKETEEKMKPDSVTYKDKDGNNITTGIAGKTTTSVMCDMIEVTFGTKKYDITIEPATGKIHL